MGLVFKILKSFVLGCTCFHVSLQTLVIIRLMGLFMFFFSTSYSKTLLISLFWSLDLWERRNRFLTENSWPTPSHNWIDQQIALGKQLQPDEMLLIFCKCFCNSGKFGEFTLNTNFIKHFGPLMHRIRVYLAACRSSHDRNLVKTEEETWDRSLFMFFLSFSPKPSR